MQRRIKLALLLGTLTGALVGNAWATGNQHEPVELLVKFKVSGQLTGFTSQNTPVYTVSGPGYAGITTSSAEVLDLTPPGLEVAQLSGAQITFTGAPTDPIVPFTCLPGSCTLTFKDGSVLVSDAGVPLQGRAINMWGPVVQSPDFDPANGIMPIRILGCGGLKEVAGKGKLAGMVGSICFNGSLNFNTNNPTVLTGGSNCTITMHTPAPGVPIP
jgi:hypothetical protein